MKGEPATCPHCGANMSAQVSLGAIHAAQTRKPAAPKKAKRTPAEKGLLAAVIAMACVLCILLGVVGVKLIPSLFINKNANIDTKFDEVEQGELNINTDLPTQGIQNIALFGLDERGETDELYDESGKAKSFHSDAIIILTIDSRDPDNPRVKMSSLARDTLVYVEGYNSKNSRTKLTHAFDFGYRNAKSADRADGKMDYTEADYKREGAKTAIKTINANFNMNITEYVYVNFVEFMDIIDYVGGVTINVQQRELNELNKHVRAMRKECGRDIAEVKTAGEQTLSGGQALAYARIRKIDSDLKRTNRQRDVLQAMFDKVKSTQLTKLPDVAAKILSLCHTTLNAEEMVEIGTWALTKGPEIINYTLPDTKVNANWIWEGSHPNYGWVWIYDLRYATHLLHDFIYDTESAKEQPLPTMPNEPKVTAATTTTTTIGDVTDPTGDPTDVTDPTGDPTDVVDPTGDSTGDPTGDPTDVTDPTGDPTDPIVTAPTEGGDPTDPTDPTTSTQEIVITTTTTNGFVTP